MTSDLDIIRSARVLIIQHGTDQAFKVATLHMESLALKGDLDGMEIYSKILLAISALTVEAADRVLH